MKIIIIAAHDPNLVIGNNGTLPWHFSEDLKHFKQTTSGFPILMGRGVFEELGSKPLPNRQNIVLSTTQNYDNVACYSSLEQALEAIKLEQPSKLFIIGGGCMLVCKYIYVDVIINISNRSIYMYTLAKLF